ncbi:hypothetical protein K2173_015315 [Erythroxylum novogranatense]|uniref:Uncharacterized protein n=1 Tax=Erythroxylum novogranatense TaxID=1862640 RepID=A0AAV8T264_9ROSI|nr:hypothetical protein K2173_015315 [Erythroxylum novogranatense]
MDESSKEKATRETRVDFSSYSSSRRLFLDAFKAVLNCLGVEWEIKECYLPLELKDDNKSQGATYSQEPAQTTATTFTSGTALEADPPTNVIPSEDPAPTSIRVTSVPKQPPVSGGGGPKIN